MELQDKEREYEHNVWEIYRKEFATASPEKKTELNKRMRRWQELMNSGLPAQQAYYKAMEGELDYRVMEKPSGKQLAITSPPRMRKAPLILLSLALVAAIIYSVVITGNIKALNTELESAQSVLASTQAQLISTKQTLTSIQSELSSTKQTLASTQSELSSTEAELTSTQAELKKVEAELLLYKDTLGIQVFSGVQPGIQKGDWSLLRINNTTTASNPSWQQLVSFLLADPTDDKYYSANFDCVDFAEMLHNNAEIAGIRAAFVAVHFENDPEGHALNAFKTVDKGLVYVDCTGGELLIGRTSLERDKIAYVTKGKEYGIVGLEQDTPIDYASYEKMKADWSAYPQKLEAYNQEVAEYNSAYSRYKSSLENALSSPIAELHQDLFKLLYGRTFEEEEKYLKEQREWLNSIRAQLEKAWEPLGIVKGIEIYW